MSSTVPEDPFGSIKKPASNTVAPAPQEVNNFHARSDVDSGDAAQHHTLGTKHNQASPGDHKHDGKSSKLLLENKVLTGSKGGNAALANLITMLADNFGFTDSTT
jgi:hypothetical protein